MVPKIYSTSKKIAQKKSIKVHRKQPELLLFSNKTVQNAYKTVQNSYKQSKIYIKQSKIHIEQSKIHIKQHKIIIF